jgi:ketosteroid isomerase-like protein
MNIRRKMSGKIMKRLLVASVGCGCLCLMLLAALSGNPSTSMTAEAQASKSSLASGDQSAVQSVIENILNLSQRVTQEKNLALAYELEQYFDPNVTIIDAAGFTTGWANYRDNHLANQFATVTNNHKVADLNVTVNGNVAWATYRYTLDVLVDGSSVTLFGYGSVVLERKDNQWKVVLSQAAGRRMRAGDPVFN